MTKIVRKAGEYGIGVFIDPHQDVWSRFTGGSGAPRWTLERRASMLACSISRVPPLHQEWTGSPESIKVGNPRTSVGHNYGRLATATMFTLFFGGRDFAPSATITATPGEKWKIYKTTYSATAAPARIARQLKGEPNVLGFDTLNEPSNGWIGIFDIDKLQTVVLTVILRRLSCYWRDLNSSG